jgi:hypothetical protein
MRKLRRDFNRRMLWLVAFVLVVVGGALIGLVYGFAPALIGVGCLLAGASLIGLLWLVFTLVGKWAGDE